MLVKVGIIGFGYMGHFHLQKARKIKDVEVIAAYDISADKLQDAEYERLKSYSDLHEFLSLDLELILICTPNDSHMEYAIAAMKSGKSVMCEKPATMSVRELETVMEYSKETGKIFTVHQNRRWDVDYLAVRDAVWNNTIGKITTIESRVLGERGVCFGWRADPKAGGGMLYDWGVHLIDQMLELFKGEVVESVYARILSILTPAVDDFFEINMMFSGGTCAKVIVGTFALQKLPRWFVFGDRGTMKLDDFSGETGGLARIRGEVDGFESVVGKKSLGPSRTMAPLATKQLERLELPQKENISLEFWDNLVKAVKGESEPYVKQSEVLRQIQVVESAFLSAEKNEVLKVQI